MILKEEAYGMRRVHGNFVHALAERGIFHGQEHRANAAVFRRPSASTIVCAINSAGGDRHIHALFVSGVGSHNSFLWRQLAA